MAEGVPSKVQQLIAEHGWAVIMVEPGADGTPGFAYTVGLQQTLGHPELIMVGVPLAGAQSILNSAAAMVESQGCFVVGQEIPQLFGNGFRAAVRHVKKANVRPYLRFCSGRQTEALQIVMPDAGNRFPWEKGYNSEAMRCQILLY